MTTYDESKHPRVPAGQGDRSGQWTVAEGAARKAAGLDIADFVVEDLSEESIESLNLSYDSDYMLFSFDEHEVYQIRLEGWFPDCMESRGRGRTTEANIRKNYESIMKQESGWEVLKSGYLSNRRDAEFGVSYIIRRITQ